MISIRNLNVRFGDVHAVSNVSFDVEPGRALGLVGESGSGKSVTARSMLGLSGGQASAERLRIDGRDAREFSRRDWQAVRGSDIALILQDALGSLDPLRPIYRELSDGLDGARAERRARAEEALDAVSLPGAGRLRSGELSGGMRQRAIIAQALIDNPSVVIADEATTALDTRLTAMVLRQLREIRDAGRAVLMISHDLAQVREVVDEVAVMRSGEIVEQGPTEQVLGDPHHEYTQRLLAAVPTGKPRFYPLSVEKLGENDDAQAAVHERSGESGAGESADPATVAVTNISKKFGGHQAVKNVSFEVPRGQTLGLVGESGSGKTTTARMVLGLTQPDSGEISVDRTEIAAIFQNPLASFDPRYTVHQVLANALSVGRTTRGYRKQIAALLEQVELPASCVRRHPRELSGGQRQRLAIARALATNPRLLVLDEPVSALDVSIQATVLDLLDEIQRDTGASYLFISHDLGVIEHMSDAVAVMRAGEIVEQGADVLKNPRHPYTQELVQAVPRL